MNFMEDTRAMLLKLDRTITLTEVGKHTGLTVAWLSRFARGDVDNPGVRQVEILRNWLNAREG